MNKLGELFRLSKTNCVFLKTSESIRDENFYYFSQLDKSLNLNTFMVLKRGRKPLVLANDLEYKTLLCSSNFAVRKFSTGKELESLLRRTLPRRVGINYGKTSVASVKAMRKILPGRKFVDVSKNLGTLRTTKTGAEIKKLAVACRTTSEILESVPDMLEVGMSEKDLENKIGEAVMRSGCSFSFNPIIATGASSSVPHHITSKAKIRKGVLLVDIGVAHLGYCSDMTRTFYVGRAPEDVNHVYSAVKKAQSIAISTVKAGVDSRKLFKASNDFLKKELGQSMIHSLGHGIGLNVHDFPEGISEKYGYALKENMVLALEPAFYGKHFGIRIEDDLVVGKKSAKMLSRSPEEIVEI